MLSTMMTTPETEQESARSAQVEYCDFLMAKFKAIATDDELQSFVPALPAMVSEASVLLPEDREDLDLVGMAFNAR
ncbi:MAG: hypothetical protein NTV52_33675 [Acidobacteria bacterium]|nr:hypothetical protein [Acidobacteriota bacterium]